MKIAVLTSKERFETYTDTSMVPSGTEFIFLPTDYTEDEAVEKLREAEAVLVDAVLPVTGKMIEAMPKLKFIQSEGVGYDRIDTESAARAGVYVSNNRAVNAGPVAEHCVMLILALMHRLMEGDAQVRAGRQMETKTRFIAEGLEDLSGKRVGLIGFGAIGRELAKRLAPFGCSIFYNSRGRCAPELEREYGVEYLELEELLKSCDIISLHVPVTPETTNLIRRETLELMKPGAMVINAARGLVVNTGDQAEAIMSGRIYGAALDTIEPEPVPADSPILLMPEPYCRRVVLSPHVAGTTKSVFRASYRRFWSNVAAVMEGRRPENIVNGL